MLWVGVGNFWHTSLRYVQKSYRKFHKITFPSVYKYLRYNMKKLWFFFSLSKFRDHLKKESTKWWLMRLPQYIWTQDRIVQTKSGQVGFAFECMFGYCRNVQYVSAVFSSRFHSNKFIVKRTSKQTRPKNARWNRKQWISSQPLSNLILFRALAQTANDQNKCHRTDERYATSQP